MGIYDREYYRKEGPSFLGHIAQRGIVCKWLIGITVAVFVIQMMTMVRIAPGISLYGDFTQALWLDSDEVLSGQVWRLLTHAFLHSFENIWHIVFNMLLLWWFGHEIESMLGPKEFIYFYILAAIFSGVIYTLTSLNTNAVALGASGAVTAIMVLYACHFPKRTVLLFFVIPMPIWLLVVGFVALDAFKFLAERQGRMQTEVAVAGHLGGALFGFLYYKLQWRFSRFGDGIRAWFKRRSQPKLKVYREEPDLHRKPTPVNVTAPSARSEVDEQLEARVDAVLEKVSRVGKEGLTEDEKELLLRASEIYKNRRH